MKCQCQKPERSGCEVCRACWACCSCQWWTTEPTRELNEKESRELLLQAVNTTERVIGRAQRVLDDLSRAYTLIARVAR